eukprot:CAMPEP_0197009990 /NCGR_PEP_ID=MMETSP1380-20130617/52337_1 /TAXON_ID=5936 /ORGANISM="Euplotes crassus, Strain CT5" /LENGTH=177 /DNA_ID=CAMNT_0042431605 /DNA_START=14 /DNA_END=547 /DNA_ORIENTATION=+
MDQKMYYVVTTEEFWDYREKGEGLGRTAYVPRVLNLAAMALEVFLAVFLVVEAQVEGNILMYFYGFTMVWSLVFHLLPFLTKNFVFRLIVRVIVTIEFFLLVVILFLMVTTDDPRTPSGYLALLIFFIGPSLLVGATLYWALESERNSITPELDIPYKPEVTMEESKVSPSADYVMI